MKLLLSILLVCFAAVAPAGAMGDIFIRAKEPSNQALSYTGDSLSADFPGQQGWFELSSLSFGIQNTVLIDSGSGGAGAGKATPLPVSALKFPNSASAAFFSACAIGHHWNEFEIVFTKVLNETRVTTLKLELKLVLVTSVGIDGSAFDDGPVEEVSVEYGAHRITFFGHGKDGSYEQVGQSIWSFVLNRDIYEVQ